MNHSTKMKDFSLCHSITTHLTPFSFVSGCMALRCFFKAYFEPSAVRHCGQGKGFSCKESICYTFMRMITHPGMRSQVTHQILLISEDLVAQETDASLPPPSIVVLHSCVPSQISHSAEGGLTSSLRTYVAHGWCVLAPVREAFFSKLEEKHTQHAVLAHRPL